ncbi:hypothetical protein NXS08_05770 [Gleimia sp. 6138-11-ORH1]|uniref:hypothetical protein n=1 Tax=Gleimia sp. 6138-11-ORH1 TaxID=2973937 RepID=UPI0021682094|nr:hypothetical protein [Gleimia sp. 6138-11-ORH1]MCS4484976.1 hypothetical protein [Gleimia sp. 6138-11-ORH1]
MAISDSDVLLLTSMGASSLGTDSILRSIDLPKADEVILDPDGTIYACNFNEGYFEILQYQFRGKKFTPTGFAFSYPISELDENDLVVLGIPGGIQLWLHTERKRLISEYLEYRGVSGREWKEAIKSSKLR